MDTAGQARTLKEGDLPTIRTIVWTLPDRSRPNFKRQGVKTGGPAACSILNPNSLANSSVRHFVCGSSPGTKIRQVKH